MSYLVKIRDYYPPNRRDGCCCCMFCRIDINNCAYCMIDGMHQINNPSYDVPDWCPFDGATIVDD